MPSEPSFSCIYGELKAGKTADTLACFPQHTVWVAAPGALAPAESVWGFPEPERRDFETFKDILEFVDGGGTKGAVALVVDDASLIADRSVNAYTAKYGRNYDLWGALFTVAIKLRDSLRRKGCHVVFTTHLSPAEVKQGVRLKGGPAFPGQTRSKLPAAADLLLRAEPREGLIGWRYAYRCASPHVDWLQGSRYDTPDPAPMNLREILRHAGFVIPRLRGLEWQDDFADRVAQGLRENLGSPTAVFDYARAAAMAKGASEAHVLWAIRDGFDRAILSISPKRTRSLYGLGAPGVQ